MQIIDYVIIGFAVLFLVIGLIRGMVKMTFGLLAGLASLVIAIMLCTSVAGLIVTGTNWDDRLANSIAGGVTIGTSETLVYDTQPDKDVLGYYVTEEDGSQVFKEFDTLFEGNVFWQLLSGPMESGIRANYTVDSQPKTASSLIAAWLAVLILQVICFFVLWALAAIVLKVISILLKKLVSATFAGHFIDRVLGAVVGVAIAWVVVMVVFTGIGLMHEVEFMKPVMEHIESSTIGKLLYDNNLLYNLVSENIDFSGLFAGAAAAAPMLTTLI